MSYNVSQKNRKNAATQLKSINEVHANLLNYVEYVPDPRVKRTQKHILKDILTIAILAVIGGAEGWEDIENYGLAKQKWLAEFLELPEGIPSDDTFRRVFERIDPQVLEQCLSKWVRGMVSSLDGKIIPVDGKTIKGSYDRQRGLKALHLVTAIASEQRLILGQIKVEDSSNEITAIPALLELLDIAGAIVTIDAMGTQSNIVKLIRDKKADYVLSLKANHPTLFSQVKQWFNTAKQNNFQGIEADYEAQIEKGHHRTEKRYVWAVPVKAFGGLHQQEQWSGLQTIVIVERIRHLWNKTTKETQFYLSSLPPNARLIGRAIRKHWTIENYIGY